MLVCRDQRNGTGCGAHNLDDTKHCIKCGRSLRFALSLRNIGDRIGSYRIVRVIGHGGFGAVYEVEVTQRPAIHVTLKESFDLDAVRAFAKEFAILRSLQHDNLPRYLETFEADQHGYLVMEFVPGQNLDDLLRQKQGPVLEKLVVQYADQLCDVLTYLHSQTPPLLHRDIKPSNVRLTPEGLIKLVDFGLLKQGTDTTRHTHPRAGTLAYAPIEQWIGGTDQRSDIYGLGATIYHLLTGQSPTPAGVRNGAEPDPLPLPISLNPRISPYIAAVVLKAMSVQREDRYADIATFHQALLMATQRSRRTGVLPPPSTEAQPTPTAPLAPAPQPPSPPSPPIAPMPAHRPRTIRVNLQVSWSAHYDSINSLAWCPTGQCLASASDDGRIRLWAINAQDLPDTTNAITIGGAGRVFSLAWSPDGKLIASGGKDEIVRLWNGNDGSWAGTWSGHVGQVNSLAWHPAGRMLLSASWDRTIRIWQVTDGTQLQVLTSHMQAVNCVAWGPGERIVSGSSDTTLRLWLGERGTVLTVLRGHTRSINCVAWSPDDLYIASGSGDNTVRLWKGADGIAHSILYGHTDSIFSVAWSPDNQLLASASADRTIRIWRVTDSFLLATLEGHTGQVSTLSWSPDGRLLASAGADRTIRLWRIV